MTGLISDAVIAMQQIAVRILRGDSVMRRDRGADFLANLEAGYDHLDPDVHRLRQFPPAVDGDAQPAGAGDTPAVSATGTGGHPIRPTSVVLESAANFVRNYKVTNVTAGNLTALGIKCVDEVIDELTDRAAQFRAHGD